MSTDSDSPFNYERHFTREEANLALEEILPILQSLRDAKDLLTDEEAHEVLTTAAPTNGGGERGVQIGNSFLQVQKLLSSLQVMGILIRDIDRGLIDFPSIRDGREIYLCWQLDEDSVGNWHELDSDFSGREPLD